MRCCLFLNFSQFVILENVKKCKLCVLKYGSHFLHSWVCTCIFLLYIAKEFMQVASVPRGQFSPSNSLRYIKVRHQVLTWHFPE